MRYPPGFCNSPTLQLSLSTEVGESCDHRATDVLVSSQ